MSSSMGHRVLSIQVEPPLSTEDLSRQGSGLWHWQRGSVWLYAEPPGSLAGHGPPSHPQLSACIWALRLPKVQLHGHMVPGKPSDKPWGVRAEQREVHRAGGQGTGLLLFLALSLED